MVSRTIRRLTRLTLSAWWRVREMGYALNIIEEGRAGGAIFDRVPFLVSFDAAGVSVDSALWEPEIPAETASMQCSGDGR